MGTFDNAGVRGANRDRDIVYLSSDGLPIHAHLRTLGAGFLNICTNSLARVPRNSREGRDVEIRLIIADSEYLINVYTIMCKENRSRFYQMDVPNRCTMNKRNFCNRL